MNRFVNILKNFFSLVVNPFFGSSDTYEQLHNEYSMLLFKNKISLKEGRKVLAKHYMREHGLPEKYFLEDNGTELFAIYMSYIISLTEVEFEKFVSEAGLVIQ